MKQDTYTLTVSLDFDGVIHRYSRGWHTKDIYDPPMEGALDGIRTLLRRYRVVITTARDANEVMLWMRQQMPDVRFEDDVFFFANLPEGNPSAWWYLDDAVLVTNRKMVAVSYVDDRAIRFVSWVDLLNHFR